MRGGEGGRAPRTWKPVRSEALLSKTVDSVGRGARGVARQSAGSLARAGAPPPRRGAPRMQPRE